MEGLSHKISVSPGTSLIESLKVLDKGGIGFIIIINENKQLLGVATDGDIRRGLINGLPLSCPIDSVMNRKPTCLNNLLSTTEIINIMKSKNIRHIPIINQNKQLVDIAVLDNLIRLKSIDNVPVIIMAGGHGKRLRPLTENIPKPLLKLGSKTILSHILEKFRIYGLKDITILLNYLPDKIIKHCEDLDSGLDIKFIIEDRMMGTAGGLKKLQGSIEGSFFVMNCDILTNMNLYDFLSYHKENKFDITLAVKRQGLEIPYGIVDIEGDKIVNFNEKPFYEYFINAGIYLLKDRVLELIPDNTPYNMDSLIQRAISDDFDLGYYNILEYWIDVGKHSDFYKAMEDIPKYLR